MQINRGRFFNVELELDGEVDVGRNLDLFLLQMTVFLCFLRSTYVVCEKVRKLTILDTWALRTSFHKEAERSSFPLLL